MSARVLIADSMSPKAAEILAAAEGIEVEVKVGLSPEALNDVIASYDAILVRSATKLRAAQLERASRLKLIGRAGIGVDNIDVAEACRRDIVVMNTPFGNAVTTAEHAIAMLMAVSRNIPQATASMKAGRWDKKLLKGREIFGKTLGLVGIGNIGGIVADRASALRMRVIAFDPMLPEPAVLAKGAAAKVELAELLAQADYISVHTPKNEHTTHLLNAAAFEAMKPGVFVINCARGGIVEEAALLAALESGKVAGAALDVYETEPPSPGAPLLQHPNVILTPHIGASTHEAQENVAVQIAQQTVGFFQRGETENRIER